ncbi:MAG: 50S ribosomal protein L24 [Planctomycetota bacterium]|nr:MAG: 50S ribosomal protein L24 [Planctomycetota bacterium]
MSIKTKIKKGDLVKVIAGNHKDVQGKVIAVFPEQQRVKIENVNMVYKHKRVDRQNNTGGRIQEEGTIHISNVLPVDSESNKASRIRIDVIDGKKIRVLVKSGNALD